MASPASLRVVIAGGGTGGHLYPGIAVARELRRREPDATVTFAGTALGLEARVVPREGFELDVIRSAGLKGKSPVAFAGGLALLPFSGWDAWRLVSRRTPHLVIGTGGYSSGPVVLAAAVRGIPTLLLEQNAAPGFTNRLLARITDAAAVAYESALPHFRGRAFVAGNPVRSEFFERVEQTAAAADPASRLRVLIVGGSQGSHAINMAMVAAAPELARHAGRLAITHQTGARDEGLVRDAYGRSGLEARVEPFLDPMHREMTQADIVVCRAGATTLAEVTAAARAAILVPLPAAADDHQRRNAGMLAGAGAAELLDERDLTGPLLARRLLALADDAGRRARLAAAAGHLARPDAARLIVDRALALAGRRRPGA